MTRRPWLMWWIFLAVDVGSIVLNVVYGRSSDDSDARISISVALAFGVFATVGALITSRRPGHGIGRIYLVGALAAAVGLLGAGLIDLDRATAGRPPGTAIVWFVADLFSDAPLVALVALPLLLFPNGTLPSRRWRVPFGVSVVCLVLIAARSFVPGHFDNPPSVAPANPLGIPGAKSILETLSINAATVIGVIALVSIGRLFLRFRRAAGTEREQLKWLGWAGFWTLFLLFMSGPGTYAGLFPDAIVELLLAPLTPFLFAIALSVIPLFTAVAILRYRLYDIDRIVSRTVSYILITGLLLGGYLLLVVVFQLVTRPITEGSDVAVAASTLVVAAAFRPVRRRVQRAIDHRFNRSRYDAAEAIELFTARLRDEVDIDTLSADLQTLVHHTMEPTHVSLWLKTKP